MWVRRSLIVERDCIRLLDLDCNKPFVFEKYAVLLIVECTSVRGRKKSPTMSKDKGKKLPQLYYINMKISYECGFYCNRSRHGNVTTPLRFLSIFVFLGTKFFFLRNRLREFVFTIIASIMAKFEQILWERFRDILQRSFKHHKSSEIAYY